LVEAREAEGEEMARVRDLDPREEEIEDLTDKIIAGSNQEKNS